MILPQKFSKRLGDRRLKGSASLTELFVISWSPIICNYFGLDPFVSLMSFLMLLAGVWARNKLLGPSFIENFVLRQTHMKWERVRINVKED